MDRIKRHRIELEEVTDEMTEEAEEELVENYKESLTTVKQEMADIYQKYEVAGVLTLVMLTRYKRLQKLYKKINKELYNLTGKNATATKKSSTKIYKESYYRTSYIIEQAAGIKLGSSLLNARAIKASIENPISGLTLTETLQKNRAATIWNVKRVITQGLIQGSSYKEIADKLTKTFEGDAAKAIRVVKTEAHRNREAGSLAAAKYAQELGVTFTVIWSSTLDGRTRDQHQSMDDKEASVRSDGSWFFTFPDGIKTEAPGLSGYAHHDVNCRCSTLQYPTGTGPTVRRVDGQVRTYINYDQWVEENL